MSCRLAGADTFRLVAANSSPRPERPSALAENYSDKLLRSVLNSVRSFACVGVSGNDIRPSYFVARYLKLRGYSVIPVNPRYAGQRLFGSEVYPSLEEIPGDIPVDAVDIFRRSEEVPAIVESALARFPDLKAIWMQVGIVNDQAAARARGAGVRVIQDRCPKIEHQRLNWELRMAGFNTGIISSKRQ